MNLNAYVSDLQRRADLASAIGSSPDYLYQIATNRRSASARLARLIEQESARLGPEPVTKESLRPDIWPELVTQQAAAA